MKKLVYSLLLTALLFASAVAYPASSYANITRCTVDFPNNRLYSEAGTSLNVYFFPYSSNESPNRWANTTTGAPFEIAVGDGIRNNTLDLFSPTNNSVAFTITTEYTAEAIDNALLAANLTRDNIFISINGTDIAVQNYDLQVIGNTITGSFIPSNIVAASQIGNTVHSVSVVAGNASTTIDICTPFSVASLDRPGTDEAILPEFFEPECSDISFFPSLQDLLPGQTLTATLNNEFIHPRDTTKYMLRFSGFNDNVPGNGVYTNLNGNEFTKFNSTENTTTNLSLTIPNINTTAIGGGSISIEEFYWDQGDIVNIERHRPLCSFTIEIDPEDGTVTLTDKGARGETNPFDLCSQIPSGAENDTARSACSRCVAEPTYGVWTALGCIETEGSSIITSFIKIALGMAGGIGMLMIIAAGAMFTLSRNDPTKVGNAKELLTSVIVGLLFIVFSITILQFIGVTILQIPGFGV